MYKGQHIYVKKASGSYTHHGLGIGGDRVIHYSGLSNESNVPGIVEEISLSAFSDGQEVHIKPYLEPKYTADESITRVCLRLGESQYHVLHNNCEHLVAWSITGLHKSYQSTRGKFLYSAGIGARALLGSKNPFGFLAGAAAGYAYVHYEGSKKTPDFVELEKAYEQLVLTKQKVFNLPRID